MMRAGETACWVRMGAGLFARACTPACLVFFLATSVYFRTLCKGVYPGHSALETAQAMGLAPVNGHAVALAAARIVTAMPVSDVPLLLNIFNAMCGGLAVALFYLVSKRLVMELTRPELDACAALEDIGEKERRTDMDDGPQRTAAATLGGVIGSLALAFSAPYWRASTSYSTHLSDIVLLLLLAWALLRCQESGERCACVAAMFLCGLGVAESPLFLTAIPVTVLLVMRAVIHSDSGSEQAVPYCLLAGLAGAAANVALSVMLYQSATGAGDRGASDAVQLFGRAYVEAARAGLFSPGWPAVWVIPFLTLFLSFVCVRIAAFREEGLGADGWALTALLSCAVIVQLVCAPYSSWAVSRAGCDLSVMPSLMTALAAAAVFAAGYVAAAIPRLGDEYGRSAFRPTHLLAAGGAVCGILVIAVLRQPCVTAGDSDGRRAEFADRVAREVQELFGDVSDVPSGGSLDLNLRIRASGRKGRLEVRRPHSAGASGLREMGRRLARFEAVCGPLLESDPSLPPLLVQTRRQLRLYVGMKMRELGKTCDEIGCADVAAAAYSLASRMRTIKEEKGAM